MGRHPVRVYRLPQTVELQALRHRFVPAPQVSKASYGLSSGYSFTDYGLEQRESEKSVVAEAKVSGKGKESGEVDENVVYQRNNPAMGSTNMAE